LHFRLPRKEGKRLACEEGRHAVRIQHTNIPGLRGDAAPVISHAKNFTTSSYQPVTDDPLQRTRAKKKGAFSLNLESAPKTTKSGHPIRRSHS
jgi:hypothetical protein